MPEYLKQNGEPADKVLIEHTWVEFPVESAESDVQKKTETYLLPTRAVEYILLLESKIEGELPKLKTNSKQ